LKDDTSWFASFAPSKNPRYAVVMMVGQGGFGASTSGVGVRQIYSTIFGVKGNTLVPGAALFPKGKPPTQLPKISPATKPKEASK
jgi:penicillin-binding protein 2